MVESEVGVELVFVYGALLSGEPNHAALARAKFLGEAFTLPSFAMVDLGDAPAVYRRKGGRGAAVLGQLYRVTRGHLTLIDEIEGHPGRYRREEISVKMGDSTPRRSVRARAWIYLMTEHQATSRSQKIVDGLDWRKRRVD